LATDVWTFVYDALGHQVEWSSNGTYESSSLRLGNFKLSAIGQNPFYSEYPFPGGSLFSENGGGTGVQLGDWLGTSRAFWGYTGGTWGQSGAHAPFGETYAYNNGYSKDFTGQPSDGNMGNTAYYFPERHYQSGQGRWLSPDPAGLAAVNPTNPQSWNRYAYVMNNPLTNVDPLGLDYCQDSMGGMVSDDNGGDNNVNCANVGGLWVIAQDPTNVAISNADVSQAPTFQDNLGFFLLWASGVGPSTINYGPNDGMTQQLANSATFDQFRQKYKQLGCPNSGTPIQAGNHGLPFLEGFGTGNEALMQVGGFSAYGTTNGNDTTFTIVNIAGQSSFSGASTIGPVTAYFGSSVGSQMPFPMGTAATALTLNGVTDNPYGTSGPFHNIQQMFTWTEGNLCKQGG
jgi:RHS repeat-associated protein